jgi:hypothetical protein
LLDGYKCKTQQPSKKLDNKQHRPFKIIEHISPYAYRIELPPLMKCHNVFQGSPLEPATNEAYHGQNMAPTCPVEIDGEDEYFIEAVLDS